MTISSWIAPPPYSHGWLITLVLSLRTLWKAAFGSVTLFPSVTSVCQGQDCPWQRLLAIWTFFIRPRTFLPPQCWLWAWYEMGQGCQILWPHKRSFKTNKRVILFSRKFVSRNRNLNQHKSRSLLEVWKHFNVAEEIYCFCQFTILTPFISFR